MLTNTSRLRKRRMFCVTSRILVSGPVESTPSKRQSRWPRSDAILIHESTLDTALQLYPCLVAEFRKSILIKLVSVYETSKEKYCFIREKYSVSSRLSVIKNRRLFSDIGMDLSDRIALVYAEDLMEFAMRHRNIEWQSSLGSDAFEDEAKGHFPFEMGVVVVGFAKSIMKEWMHRTREQVLQRTAYAGFEGYIEEFVPVFYEKKDPNPINFMKLMAYIVEASVLLYLNHVEDAPLQGIRIISRFIRASVPFRGDMLGGLERLLHWADYVKRDPNHNIAESFISGTFYGDA